MSVLDLSAARRVRLEEQLRKRFDIKPDETAIPIGYAAALLVERTRVEMARLREREAANQ